MATIDQTPAATGAKTQAVIATFARYVVPNYRRFPVCLSAARARGSGMPRATNTSICFPAGAATCSAIAPGRSFVPCRSRWPG